jgi:hypothetical protein
MYANDLNKNEKQASKLATNFNLFTLHSGTSKHIKFIFDVLIAFRENFETQRTMFTPLEWQATPVCCSYMHCK